MGSDVIYQLIAATSSDRVRQGNQLSSRYEHIWQMDRPLKALCLILPNTTEEVSAILQVATKYRIPVVTHGGLTNLVGSTVSNMNSIVVSLERMNQIEVIDPASGTCQVQAGCILETLQEAVAAQDLMFPLNFGAKGSAHIGGILATNAGGMRVLRYGMARQLVLGLEMVLADGRILSNLKTIVKDNSGYDLKQLFIGSEGTLGIITRAVLKLEPQPESRQAAYVAVQSYEHVVQCLNRAKATFSGTLSAFELIWEHTYKAFTRPESHQRPPLSYGSPYYVLIETLGQSLQLDQQKMEDFLECLLEEEIITDAVPTSNKQEAENFFKLREDVHNLTDYMDSDQHFDVSIPISSIGSYVNSTIDALHHLDEVTVAHAFGHVADGNIHFMVDKKNDSETLKRKIDQIVYQPLKSLKGSISAEHGIGTHKKEYLSMSKSSAEIEVMRQIKAVLDPHLLLNPGKIF